MAKKASPRSSVRVSIDTPRIAGRAKARLSVPPVAAARAAGVQSGTTWGMASLSQQPRRDIAVGEGKCPVADDLAGFVTLAGNQHDIPGLRHANGVGNSLG